MLHLYHVLITWRRIQIMNLLIMQFYPDTFYFFLPRHHLLMRLQYALPVERESEQAKGANVEYHLNIVERRALVYINVWFLKYYCLPQNLCNPISMIEMRNVI